MALIIKSTETAKVQYKGLDGSITDISQVYARLEVAMRPNGKLIEVALPYIFLSKEAYKNNGIVLQTNIQTSFNGEVVDQTHQLIHEFVKSELEKVGFEIEIDL